MTGTVLGTVTTIMVVLIGLFSEGREPSRRAMCANNLKQIALAMHDYESAFGSLPPAAAYDKDGKPLLSWRVLLLPYLEERGLYDQFHLDEAWDSPSNKPLADRMPRVFQCPSGDLSQGLTTYECIVDPRSMFTGEPTGVPFSSVIDGTSRTLLVVERKSPVPWTKPSHLSLASSEPVLGMGSKHPGGFNAVMADGSANFRKTEGNDAISPQDLRALVTRDGHEEFAAPLPAVYLSRRIWKGTFQ
jgi:prepilin-type processing-associated H-X9-DG protein